MTRPRRPLSPTSHPPAPAASGTAILTIGGLALCCSLSAPQAIAQPAPSASAPPEKGVAPSSLDDDDGSPGTREGAASSSTAGGDDEGGDGETEPSAVASDAVELAAPTTPGDPSRLDLRDAALRWPTLQPALAAWRRGQAAQAYAAATGLLSAADLELRAAAGWIAAQAATRRGDKAGAEAAWRALAVAGPLVDRARIELADRAEARGDVERALALLAAVGAEHLEIDALRQRRAALHLDRGELADARRVLSLVRPARLPAALRPSFDLLRGDVARRDGQREAAVHAYQVAFRGRDERVRDLALERLAALGAAPTALQRVEHGLGHPLLVDGRPRRGATANLRRARIRALDAIAAGVPGLPDYVHGALAATTREGRADALDLLARAAAAATDPDIAAMALYRRGDLLGKLERDAEAAIDLDAALQRVRDPLVARTVRYRLARLLLYLGRGLDGERLLHEAVARDAGSEYELLALWGLAWRRWQLGDLEEAARALTRLHDRAGHAVAGSAQPWRAKSAYWLARVDAARGARQRAILGYSAVATSWPQSYYGVVALDRLRELDATAAARLQGSPPPAGEEPPPSLDDVELRPDARLAEVALLVRMGERAQARRLLRASLAAGLPVGAVQLLAVLHAHDGQHGAALAVLSRFVRSAGAPDASTLSLFRRAFPAPFREHFERAAADTGVPRALLYAIARTESSFVPTAASPVGALGLMQLMPGTATRIAALWRLPAAAAQRLRTPAANTALGARYLKELSRLVHDNHALVAAGYNAGPYAVRRWLEPNAGAPTDVLVEALPSAGARSYAMTVVATAASYAFLYPAWQEGDATRAGRPAQTPAAPGPFLVGPGPQTPPVDGAALAALVGKPEVRAPAPRSGGRGKLGARRGRAGAGKVGSVKRPASARVGSLAKRARLRAAPAGGGEAARAGRPTPGKREAKAGGRRHRR